MVEPGSWHEPPAELPDAGEGMCCAGAVIYGPQRCTCWEPVYDLDQQEPDPQLVRLLAAGVQPNVRDGMCLDCAYRPDSPERTGDPTHRASDGGDLDRLARTRRFWCHQGMRRPVKWVHRPTGIVVAGHPAAYDPPIVAGVPYQADGQPGYLCAGWFARRFALTGRRDIAVSLMPSGPQGDLVDVIDRPGLIALVGPPGAGKTTLAAAYTDRAVVLSLDELRAELSPHRDPADQQATPRAVAELHARLAGNLAFGELVVVDATNAHREHRAPLLSIARQYRAVTAAVVVLPPLADCLARNNLRADQPGPCGYARRVPTDQVEAMHTQIAGDVPHLANEGWHLVVYATRPDAASTGTEE